MDKPKIILFWTGWKRPDEWGTGIQKILEKVKSWEIQAQVTGIITNHLNGWVENKAKDFWIEAEIISNFPKRREKRWFSWESRKEIKQIYKEIMKKYEPDYIFMSWWLKYILWLPNNKTINIHPGPTKAPYGGKWMYGDNIHKKIWEDYEAGKIKKTCITMHYITKKFDDWPTIAQIPVRINKCKSWEDVKQTVNEAEHKYQWKITKLVIEWKIKWSGEKEDPVEFPKLYRWNKKIDLTKSIEIKKKKQEI
jgi:phosphoribosylglycinamide formyltransferase-1